MAAPAMATVFQLGMVAIGGIEFGACVARLT